MPLFTSDPKSFLGVDLGGSVIKLVELENIQSRPRLLTYGYAEKPIKESAMDNFLNYPDEISSFLTDLCKKSRVTTNKAITALPAPAVFSSIITLPNIKKSDLSSKTKIEAAVKYEVKKVVPLPIDEMILDWKLLNTDNKNSKKKNNSKDSIPEENYQVLLTGAAKKLVKKYMDIFKKAGLELISLETESFALTRSLIGSDKSVIMIVDIGANSTYILIVDGGIPFFDRTINAAGMNITRAISDTLKVPLDKAEQFKFDYSVAPKAKSKKLPKIIKDTLGSIIHEINYCYNLYQQDEYGGKDIEKIILSGGTSLLPNVTETLSELLKTRVFVGDPWARIDYPEEMRPILNEIGSKFSIAIGLAMRDKKA